MEARHNDRVTLIDVYILRDLYVEISAAPSLGDDRRGARAHKHVFRLARRRKELYYGSGRIDRVDLADKLAHVSIDQIALHENMVFTYVDDERIVGRAGRTRQDDGQLAVVAVVLPS